MAKTVWTSKFFYGNKISSYGLENGWIDYRTLSKAFDAVLCNSIFSKTWESCGDWETVNGSEIWYENDDGDEITEDEYWENGGHEYYTEIYQYYIISDPGARILMDYTDEIVFYNETLDLYVWGVTHWGTSWDYVLTNIKIELPEEETK